MEQQVSFTVMDYTVTSDEEDISRGLSTNFDKYWLQLPQYHASAYQISCVFKVCVLLLNSVKPRGFVSSKVYNMAI